MLPDYKIVGQPRHYRNGRGQLTKSYLQKYRILKDPARKIRSVSLQTTDLAIARRRAVRFVEQRIREIAQTCDPVYRTAESSIIDVLQEYVGDLLATGNSPKQAKLVEKRLQAVIEQAKLSEYAQVDAVIVTKAIAHLKAAQNLTTTTANKYREAMRAWSRWMKKNGRWPTNPLEDMPKLKGDTSNSRPRAILSDAEIELLLRSVRYGPNRRNLSGEQRYWLYLLASQTGLRAQELNSLASESFHLDAVPPYVEVHCTISKRRKTDRVLLRQDFAESLRSWLSKQQSDRRLWANSRSWWSKAWIMLREDFKAAGIPYERKTPQGTAVIDFHSFRAYRVTKAMLTGKSSRVVMAVARLSCESLLDRYLKIPVTEIEECTESVPFPMLD